MLMWKFYFLFYLAFFFGLNLNAQIIPEDEIIPICDSQTITVGAPNNTGIYNLTIPCNTGMPLSPFMDFYYLQILSGTTFTFTVTPVGNDDYDFGAYLNPNWNNINATPTANKRGSQNDPFQSGVFELGLSLTATDLCETGGSAGYPEPGKVRYFDVQAGDEILIAIDRWSETSQGYSISFGGDAILDCTVLGKSYGKCDVDDNNTEPFVITDFLPDLNTEFPNHVFEFYYTQSDAESGSGPQVVFPFHVQYNGGTATEMFVRVENQSGGFVRVLKNFLYVNKLPELINSSFEFPIVCNDGDGQAVFDLTQAQINLVANPAMYTFKYYTTLADANAGGNNNINQPTAYNSGNATIYVRIETGELDGNLVGCFTVAEIILKISDFNVASQNINIDPICDEDGNGSEIVDLTVNITQIVNNPNDYQISYHTSQSDADNNLNPIPNPTSYSIPTGNPIAIYVRIKDLTDDCYSLSQLNFNINERPNLNLLNNVEQCVDQENGNFNFDLTIFASEIVNNPNNYSISYHTSMNDAETGQNPIANPAVFPIPVNTTQTVYIRVSANDCSNIGSVEIKISANPQVQDLASQAFCSNQQNGNITYDLTQHESEWINNPNDFDFSYHLSQLDADNNQNPIANPNAFSIPIGVTTQVYIRIQNPQSNCYKTTILTLVPGATASLNENLTIDLCDENFDGIYEYNLNLLNNQLTGNTSGLNFAYFTSQQNAIDDQNPIPSNQWGSFSFTSLPTEIWVVATTVDECRSVPVSVNFIKGTEISTINNIIGPIDYCEGEAIDLTNFENEITTETVSFSYHLSLSDARNNLNPIANTTQYLPQGNNSVYVRLEGNACPVIAEIRFNMHAIPSIELNDTSIELCPGTTFEAIASSDDPQANFIWYLNDVEVGIGANYTITQNGVYTVVVNSLFGCSNESNITVSTPDLPIISGIESGQNYIIVTAQPSDGSGMLEYSLDDVFWQNNPKFSNLIPGEVYTVFVREDGCMKTSYQITLLLITNFISPNGDGKNDTWEIGGTEILPNATLKIFDRYGKIFVDTNFEGNYVWNGTYMGRSVASGDYWYIIQIPDDGVIKSQKFVGHISVRNR